MADVAPHAHTILCGRCERPYTPDYRPVDEAGEIVGEPQDVCPCGSLLGALAPPARNLPEIQPWVEHPPDLADSLQLQLQIQELAEVLVQVGGRLGFAIKRRGTVEAEFKKQRAMGKLKIWERFNRAGERPPAEDIREGMVMQEAGAALFESRLAWEAEVEALVAYKQTIETAISARQTLLKKASESESLAGQY